MVCGRCSDVFAASTTVFATNVFSLGTTVFATNVFDLATSWKAVAAFLTVNYQVFMGTPITSEFQQLTILTVAPIIPPRLLINLRTVVQSR